MGRREEAMKPGRELDVLIAEKVMNLSKEEMWGIMDYYSDGSPALAPNFPPYSSDIAAAWEVVEKLKYFDIQAPGAPCNGDEYENTSSNWRIELKVLDCAYSIYSEGETAPHAICLAALRSVGVVV